MTTRASISNTPRRGRHNNFKENIYFEPGKQGRKTGLVLKDSGVRDEFGFEPVSGIFSSPEASPQRSPQRNNANNTALGSSDMVLQESSIPEVTETLTLRKTPHLPPKTQTPRHTNIGGSPVRHSSIKPQSRQSSPVHPLSAKSTNRTSRRLDFQKTNNVPPSPSPFKPRPARSSKRQQVRKSVFDLASSPNKPPQQTDEDIDRSIDQVQSAVDQLFDHDQQHKTPPSSGSSSSQKRGRVEPASPSLQHPASAPRSHKRQRPSLDNQEDHTMPDHTTVEQTELDPTTVDQTQIDPTTLEQTEVDPTAVDQTEVDPTTVEQTEVDPTTYDQTEVEPTTYEQTEVEPTTVETTEIESSAIETTEVEPTAVDQTEAENTTVNQTVVDYTTVDQTEAVTTYDDTVADATIADQTVNEKSAPQSVKNRQFQVQGDIQDEHEDEVMNENGDHDDVSSISDAQDFIPPPDDIEMDQSEPEPEPQPEPPKKGRRGKAAAKPKTTRKKQTSPIEARPKPVRESQSVGPDGLKKPGPKSLVNLRAGTPAEEEGATTTRSGRTSIKPLKYWCNEGYIWNHGEVEGVVRAEEVEQPKPKRAAPSRKRAARLGPIKEDEEEEEDLLPEAWEQELGVINSAVRVWDPKIGAGSNQEMNEDIAFASTAIKTQDVHGSSFRYAKVMTLPFFGSGMVEIPPNGFKRLKNSRKMQMVFFVHEGKVTVDIEDVQFGMTKGGVWQVPRGNNYAIMNESDTHAAKIFFAQGCEIQAPLDESAPPS